MKTRNCYETGHCRHEPNGNLYQRHQDRPRGKVDTTCCFCGNMAALERFSKNTKRMQPPVFRPEEHGEHCPRPESAA